MAEETEEGAVEEEAERKTEDNIEEIGEPCEWIVQPMQWGLVPSWHSGSPKSVGYSMINARSEGILAKNTFKRPLEKGRRCVVLVDGLVYINLFPVNFFIPNKIPNLFLYIIIMYSVFICKEIWHKFRLKALY